jgi:hypothetical protein
MDVYSLLTLCLFSIPLPTYKISPVPFLHKDIAHVSLRHSPLICCLFFVAVGVGSGYEEEQNIAAVNRNKIYVWVGTAVPNFAEKFHSVRHIRV